MKEIYCGIDLGTTNSVISRLQGGVPVPITIEEGQAIVPSVVSFDPENDQIFVGAQALNRYVAFPAHTVKSVKRLMGKETSIEVGGITYLPEDISAILLKHLTSEASKVLGQTVRKVVITVPAYFDDAQRRATIRAGELAGLEVLRIINEPTAAAFVYESPEATAEGREECILVYDLGGGTFDVSIVQLKGDIKEVLASCGDSALGGDDFDERLKNHFLHQIKQQCGTDLSHDFSLQVRLRDIAERTKIELSSQPYAVVNEVAVAVVNNEPVNLSLEVARTDFEEMTDDLVEKTRRKVMEAMEEAKVIFEDIDRIVLVGGSTRMPAVQDMLAQLFDQPMEHSVDPDLCVALGAAVQAGIIAGEPLRHILIDVAAHSLGTRTIDEIDPETGEPDYFSTIIRRNTRIPVTRSEVYYTSMPQQSKVEVEVYQGESPSCRENTLVDSFMFDLRPAPVHTPITVEFSYDLQGIIQVTVNQKGYENIKTVAVDLKNPKHKEAGTGGEEQDEMTLSDKPVNYISQKARQLLEDSRLTPEYQKELKNLVSRYEMVVVAGEDEDLVDDLEDRLVELMDTIEEQWENLE
ncbi:Hsp70 family protein [Desulfobulbus alkaliphilus]|uniref:Hsp70 family protein n=1 Tax=Desulfobulbus alkaliphilus TaxID=869814 RepID=UPI0019638C1C|nr:Hsp70 family protein [Desulfobulbus alkaliphilus]MBM9536004.1 Hsp70 family protein [Desulfobulbus alkaliphilus]